MNSEKVKEIKKVLEQNTKTCLLCDFEKNTDCKVFQCKDILDYINELESENERLSKELDSEWKDRRKAEENLHKAQWNYKIGLAQSRKRNKELKDRIAELEEALLDMVVQFCQMSKEGYLHHTFMSAEENAFDVLDIEYGEKVDDVYKRFYKKWGKKDGE